MSADDSNIRFTTRNIFKLQYEINRDIKRLQDWLIANKLTLKYLKPECMTKSRHTAA